MNTQLGYVTALALSAAVVFSVQASPAFAVSSGVIEDACRKSNREQATRTLCRCIQEVANKNLTRSEMRKVAKFFDDPHLAQETRQSDRRSDEKLWLKYRAFGEEARETCG